MKNIFSIAILLSLLSLNAKAQQPVEPSDLLLSKIRPMLSSQAESMRFFKTPADTVGIGVVTKSYQKRVYYSTQKGEYLLSGMMFDVEQNQSVNDAIMSQLKIVLPDEIIMPLHDSVSVTVGNGEKNIYAFVDLNCPYCRRLHKEIDERIAKGELPNITMHYVLVGVMGGDTKEKASAILGQPDASSMSALLNQGMDRVPVTATPDQLALGKARLAQNEAAYRNFKMSRGVPFVAGEANGSWELVGGVPPEDFYAKFEINEPAGELPAS